MNNFRNRLQAASLGVMFTWFAGTYFVVTYAVALVDGSSKLNLVEVVIRVVGAAFFGGVMTGLLAWQRFRSGGVGTLIQIRKAVKTGIVPEDAEPSVWVPALQLRRRQNVRARWLNPVIFGAFTILGIWLITQEPSNIVPWVMCVFFVVVAVLSVIQIPKIVEKIDALLAQLHAAPIDAPNGRR